MTRVAIVGGGANPEHEVSLASAEGIGGALRETGYDVVALTIARDGKWHDSAGAPLSFAAAVDLLQSCAVVVSALHGPHGEDGTLAALCDLAGLPCVGSGVMAGAAAMDKWLTKLAVGAVGVRTARGVLLRRGQALPDIELPVVVKPVSSGSSHGVALVRDPAVLAEAVTAAFALDDRVLVEELIEGREIDLAVLGRPDGSRTVAPALEILPTESGVFDLATKYDGSARFLVPAPLSDDERQALERAAITVYDALGCGGVARVDFFLTEAGPVLNEVNTMPGFTEHSQVPRMFAAAGISYAQLVDLLVRDAVTPQ
ncbi:MAG: D-alanine--D-alanine ligase family protein [Nocardioidaceae bacterium]